MSGEMEPSFCKGCFYSRFYCESGWECVLKTEGWRCKDGEQYRSKQDVVLSQCPEERKESYENRESD